MSKRTDPECYTYGRFSGRAVIRLPGPWLEKTALDDAERDALLAQCLSSVYGGDADLRTLLAVPVSLLGVCSRAARAFGRLRFGSTLRARMRMEHVALGAGMLAVAGALAVLLASSAPAGLLGLMMLGVLALVAGFERHSLHVADAFAATVLEDPAAVQSLIVLGGLTGSERCRLIYESIGPDVAERAMDRLPERQERETLVHSIAEHCGGSLYSPDTLTLARSLLSRLPSSAARLNRMATKGPERSLILGAVAVARQAYARLLGTTDSERPIAMAALASVRPLVILGATAGLLAVPLLAFVILVCTTRYMDFLIVLAALGAVLGIVVAHQSDDAPLSAGTLGWRIVVAAVVLGCTAMIGLCLTGSKQFARLALQFPLSLVPLVVVAAFSGGVFARWGPKSQPGTRASRADASKTAHTLTLPMGERESILRSRSERKSTQE